MKSKALRWYNHHSNAIDAIVDIACDLIPGAGIIKGILKFGREDENDNKSAEALLASIKPTIADLVDEIEHLKSFKEATSLEQARLAILSSELKGELNTILPQLSESITLSINNLSSKKRPKKIINGRYQLEELIGKGGQGEVFRALHLKAQNHIAIKFLPLEFGNDAMSIKALRQEYQRLVNNLRHRNIVQYRDLDQDQQSGQWFIVMDYIEGNNLRYQLLERKHRLFSLEEALKVLAPIAEALCFSHEHHIIHCDLKPENILIKKNGEVFLTDFGLAHEIQSCLSTKRMSTDIGGTMPYMAPEQYRGKRARKATDVWALGVILYEMIEGYHPFNGKSFEHYKMLICEEQPETPENLSRKQWQVLAQMLQKEHQKRPTDINKELHQILCLQSKSTSDNKKTTKSKKHRTLFWLKMAAAFLLVIAVSLMAFLKMHTMSLVAHPKSITKQKKNVAKVRYQKSPKGIIIDHKTGLEWYVGMDKNTNHYEAEKWAKGLKIAGGSWRLPNRKELENIYQAGVGERNMAPMFATTGWRIWSSEIYNRSSAWRFYFNDGSNDWYNRSVSRGYRAFAVRLKK